MGRSGSTSEGNDVEHVEVSPTGRVMTAQERLVRHGTVARGEAYFLAEVKAFNIADAPSGAPTGLVYNRVLPRP